MSAQAVDDLLTVQEVARLIERSTALVRRYCADGRLPAVLKGKTYVIRKATVIEFMSRTRIRGRPRGSGAKRTT